MPIGWLLGPKEERADFDSAPDWFDERGIMPRFAVEALLRDLDDKPSFHVRPSDVNPKFTCRRQRVWQSNHDYGVSPLDLEAMGEGSALHKEYGAEEIEVPEKTYTEDSAGDVVFLTDRDDRLFVCGVPTRGRIDWLRPTHIEDLKTKTPFWAVKFGDKAKGIRPFAYIWEPKDDSDDIKGWQIQLSIYRILLEKCGQAAPTMGRVWRRYSGVKSDQPRWKRYDFALMDEVELERVAGEWMRGLQTGLSAAAADEEAWRVVPADGLGMIGSKGNYWKCDKCELRSRCHTEAGMEVF